MENRIFHFVRPGAPPGGGVPRVRRCGATAAQEKNRETEPLGEGIRRPRSLCFSLATRYAGGYVDCFNPREDPMELHIDQIARRLDLPKRKIERWIRQGRIPLVQVGSTCSFHREALERWAAEHNLTLCLDDASPAAACSPKPAMPSLRDAMADGGVYAAVPGADGPEVLREAVDRLGFLEAGGKRRLLEKLLEREQLTSTGIGKGIAIPHPRDPLDEWLSAPRIATFFLERPVDYRSLDDQPVFVLFMLLCQYQIVTL